MIIGNGLIGTFFNNNASDDLKQNFIIFASGVSNSNETRISEFEREYNLLKNCIGDKKIIYFSSSLVGIKQNPYYHHKLKMEKFIQDNSDCLIIRIPQLIGFGGNSSNLFNYIKACIERDDIIKTNKTVKRALLDVEDLLMIVEYCKNHSGIFSLSYIEKIKVIDICQIIGNCLGKQPLIQISHDIEDVEFSTNSDLINTAITDLNIDIDGYNERIIRKYI